VAGFVGDDPDDLAGVGALHQKAGVEEQFLAAGDESVEGGVIDDVNLDRRRIEAGRLEHWRRKNPDGIFDLGVADELEFPRRRRLGKRGREQDAKHKRENAVLNKSIIPSIALKGSGRNRWRQIAALGGFSWSGAARPRISPSRASSASSKASWAASRRTNRGPRPSGATCCRPAAPPPTPRPPSISRSP